MTPYTQLVMLDLDGTPEADESNLMYFETQEEYQEWFARRDAPEADDK